MKWDPTETVEIEPIDPIGWALVFFRLSGIAVVIYGLMVVLAVTRLLEFPFRKRIVSPFVVQLACKGSLFILGIPVTTKGKPMRHRGAVVANHASWLDIFTLNSAQRVFFVSKAEVDKWPAIGLIARSTGTVFIERRASHAKVQKTQFEKRLITGDRLLFFPEGTSTDSISVLPFKSTLFAAFFEKNLVSTMWIQPVSVNYFAPKGADPRYYGWWGDMAFFPHFLKSLAAKRTGRVEILFHPPVAVSDFKDRKSLARHCEDAVREGLAERGA
ncbi:MAG: lysophospholipid acyltransferase family protein [Rhodobacterales bacterium]